MKRLSVTCRTNHGAGVGHQFNAWASAYSLADLYGLTFVHQSFHNQHGTDWEPFLNFGAGERQMAREPLCGCVSCASLYVAGKELIVRVPKFVFPDERAVLERAIDQAPAESVLHLAEDQFIPWTYFPLDKLRSKNKLEHVGIAPFHVALHIRRGQIMEWTAAEREGLFLPNSYFVDVLLRIRAGLPSIAAHIYSMGRRADFPEFDLIDNIHFHLGKDEADDPTAALRGLISANILVMSKSGFSHMAGVLANASQLKIVHTQFPLLDASWIRGDQGHLGESGSDFEERLGQALADFRPRSPR